MVSKSTANMTGKVMTVKGPIDPERLGITLMHEHLFMAGVFEGRDKPDRFVPATESAIWYEKVTLENVHHHHKQEGAIGDAVVLKDEKMATAEITEFLNWGGSTVVDVTPIGVSRDPRALFRISIATSLNIVMGCSWYGVKSHPDDMDERTVEELTDEIVRDITVGVGDTGIKAGIIGEVGIGGNPLKPNEIKIMKASARASRATGAPITLHWGGLGREKLELASVIDGEGGELTRTIYGHSDLMAHNMPLMLEVLKTGAYIQFDLLGRPGVSLSWGPLSSGTENPWPYYKTDSGTALVAYAIVKLIKEGYGDKILISQDVCEKPQLKAYGGTGYSFILETFLPHLRTLGLSEEDINKIVVENPKRILTFVEPK